MADYTLSAKITGNSDSFQKACSNAKKALSDIQKNFSSISSSLNKTGKELTSKITKPALAAGTALAGVTLGKGFARLTAIDTAKAKLEALGNSAEKVTDIMKSANASVKGTSYGLDEAATTASSAVAAGIKPGQELTRYLSLTADAAATAGRTMADMGSIFNKVQTSQAAYTEELNQLADSGIPIYQWLGEEAGLSAAEVKKMASEGEITSEMFLNAVEKNIGGAAKIVGEKSFTGALSNIWASVGRIGANFLDANGSGQGFFTQLKPLMVEFKNYLGTLEEKAATWGQVFGESFSGVIQYFKTGKVEVNGFTDSAAKIVTKLQPVIDVVKKVAGAFEKLPTTMKAGLVVGVVAAGPLISTLGKITKVSGSIIGVVGKLAPLFGGLFTPIGLVSTAVVALGAGIGALINNHLKNTQGITLFDYIKDKCSNAFSSVQSSVKSGMSTYKSELAAGASYSTALSSGIQIASEKLQKAFPQISGVIDKVSSVVSGVTSKIAPVFEKIKTEAVNAPAALSKGISTAMSTYKAEIIAGSEPMQVLFNAVDVGINSVQAKCPLLGKVISGAFDTFKSVLSVVQPIFNTLKECVTTFVSSLKSGFSEAGGSADGLSSAFSMISFALNPVMGIIKNFGPQIQELISVVSANLVPVFSTLGSTIGQISAQIIPVLSSTLSSVITTAISLLGKIIPMITSIASQILPAISQVISTLLPVVANLFSQVLPLISDLISQLLPTIISLVEQIVPVVTNLLAEILPVISQLASSLLPVISSIIKALMPAVTSMLTTVMTMFQQILPVVSTIAQTLLPVVFDVITQLTPVITEIVTIISELFVSLMPIVTQILSAILPLVTNIITVIANAVQSVLPAVVAIINVIMSVVEALMPVIKMIISVVADVISNIINVISPIISFIGMIISAVMAVITPIITFIADIIATIITYITPIIEFVTGIVSTIYKVVSDVIGKISNFISGAINTISGIVSKLTSVFSGIFNKIYIIVKGIMDKVSGIFKSVIGAIQNAWSGLTDFVGGIFDGIKNAFDTVINSVKNVINIVIDGINGAINLINLIPGVEIQPIEHLAHGTDDWQGGFAYMNEGGRGELVNLPNGSQVIPHDISVHYAKEAARANASESFVIDYDYLINGMAAAMSKVSVHHTSTIDGKVVSDTTSPLVDGNLGTMAMLERRFA